jgi:hypothetical protein
VTDKATQRRRSQERQEVLLAIEGSAINELGYYVHCIYIDIDMFTFYIGILFEKYSSKTTQGKRVFSWKFHQIYRMHEEKAKQKLQQKSKPTLKTEYQNKFDFFFSTQITTQQKHIHKIVSPLRPLIQKTTNKFFSPFMVYQYQIEASPSNNHSTKIKNQLLEGIKIEKRKA